jgi:hypothetical protein
MWESNICCDPLTSKQITVYSQKLGRVRLRFPYIYILHINLPSWRLETYLKLLLRVTHFLLLLLSLSFFFVFDHRRQNSMSSTYKLNHTVLQSLLLLPILLYSLSLLCFAVLFHSVVHELGFYDSFFLNLSAFLSSSSIWGI